MIYAISYANKRYKNALALNLKMARKYGKADRVRGYTDKDLDSVFKADNAELFEAKRGAGYWIWKPKIILDAFNDVDEGDYVVYTDAGAAFIDDIHKLTFALEASGQSIMCFSISYIEKACTKRDAFILMDCDEAKYADTRQICATYILVRKDEASIEFINKYADYVLDKRIVSDEPNVMGKPNYEGFMMHRHDQSVWSLLCKKEGLLPFADPSQFGNGRGMFPEDVAKRSTYPQIIDSHRQRKLKYTWQLECKFFRKIYIDINPKQQIKKKLGLI